MGWALRVLATQRGDNNAEERRAQRIKTSILIDLPLDAVERGEDLRGMILYISINIKTGFGRWLGVATFCGVAEVARPQAI